MGPVLRWGAVFGLLAGLYLLFAGQASADEVASAILGGAAATAYGFAQMHGSRPFSFRAPWARLVGHTLAALPGDAWRVARALLAALVRRPSAGTLSRERFRSAGNAPSANGRRALALLAICLTPASFVVRAEEDALLLHRMGGRSHPIDPDWAA